MKKLLYFALIAAFVISLQNIAFAQESKSDHSHHEHESKARHSHDKATKHGGTVVMTKKHHFEIAFKPEAIHVYLYDASQKPLEIKDDVTGDVTLKLKNGDKYTVGLKRVQAYQMSAKQKERHHHETMGADYLKAIVDLSKVEPGVAKAVFSLKGLPNGKETEVSFTETFNGFAVEKVVESKYKH